MSTDANDTELLRTSIRRFAARELGPRIERLERCPDEPFPGELARAFADAGLLGTLGEAPGGPDVELLSIALEGLAQYYAAPAVMLLAHHMGRYAFADEASDESFVGFALYEEPTESSLALEPAENGSWRVTGTSPLVVNAPVASRLVLRARGPAGEPRLVVLSTDARGVDVEPAALTLGVRGCPSADVHVRCTVAAGAAPAATPMWELRYAAALAAILSGTVGSSLAAAATYAKERYQGGSAIIEHSQVRAILAGMIAAHSICLEAAELLSGNRLSEPRQLELLLRAKDEAARATADGVQLLGGYGYMEDYGQERRLRDATQLGQVFGRLDTTRQRIADSWLARGDCYDNVEGRRALLAQIGARTAARYGGERQKDTPP